MEVHLVDGTYELFRHFFAVPSHKTSEGLEVAATRGVIGTLIRLLEDGATHIGVATDQTIESLTHKEHRIMGIQWHPERSHISVEADTALIKEFFTNDK